MSIALGAALLCAGVLLVTLFSGDKVQEPLKQTVAAAALPAVSAPKTTEPAAGATASTVKATVTDTLPATATSQADVTKSTEATLAPEEKEEPVEPEPIPVKYDGKSIGIVNAADVNMRKTPVDGEVLTTLAEGTAVQITGTKDDWYAVSYGDNSGYVAGQFIDQRQKAEFTGTGKIKADALNVRKTPAATGDVVCQLAENSYVDVTGYEKGWFAVTTRNGDGYISAEYVQIGVSRPAAKASAAPAEQPAETATAATTTATTAAYSGTGASVAATAQQYLGCSYSYGGSGPSSFDCSGLTMYVYSLYGVSLPHGATGQYNYGTEVSKSELQPGDLVFFYSTDYAYKYGHVGIYIGDGNFVHASTYGVGVITSSLDGGSYPKRYSGARRIL